MTPVVQRLKCDKIIVSPYQPRLSPATANIPEIGASIKEDGVKKPVLVRPIYKRPGDSTSEIIGYELIDGERRWRGTQWAGIKWIPSIVEDMDDAKARRLSIVLNIQSESLSDYEIALSLKAQLKPTDGSEPVSKIELGRLLSKSPSYIENHVKLLEVRAELEALARSPGKMSVALLLNDIKNRALFEELFEIVKRDDAGYRIIAILSVVSDPEARAEIHHWWKKGAKLKKLEELRDKAIEAAKAHADLLSDSTKAPDAETGQRAATNAATGGGNMSRGRQVKGLSTADNNKNLHQSVKELWWKMETVEKWAPDSSLAKRKKEALLLGQMAEFLAEISKQWKSGEKPTKISTQYPEE